MRAQDLTFLADVSQVDWARLAAYIDGEGCIRIAATNRKQSPRREILYLEVTITNTDLRLTAWLKATFGGSVYLSKPNYGKAKWAPAAAWVVSTRHAAALLEYCLAYFIIKRDQAEVALAFQSTILPDRRYGMKGRPQSIIDRQQQFREQLQTLKGTSSRAKRPAATTTIQ